MLDCGLVADTILFLLSPNAEEPVDEHGQSCLSTLFAQGLSASGKKQLPYIIQSSHLNMDKV